MKNLSSKIVLAFSSVALMAAMSACTADSSAGTTDDMEELGWANPTGGDDAGDDPAEEPSEEEVESSTSEDVASSSSKAEEPESSDSEEEENFEIDVGVLDTAKTDVPEKVDTTKDEVVSITPEKIDESMTKVEEDMLPDGLVEGDSLKGDDLFVGEKDLDFEKNDYYCKTPEGDWYVLEGSKYNSFWAKFWNWLTIKFTGKSWLDYSKVCDVIYVHPNK